MHVQTRYDNNYDIKFNVHYSFLDSDTFIVKGAEKIAKILTKVTYAWGKWSLVLIIFFLHYFTTVNFNTKYI
jgi:hypothetical protein